MLYNYLIIVTNYPLHRQTFVISPEVTSNLEVESDVRVAHFVRILRERPFYLNYNIEPKFYYIPKKVSNQASK